MQLIAGYAQPHLRYIMTLDGMRLTFSTSPRREIKRNGKRSLPGRDRKLVTNYRENRRIFPQECRVQEKYIPRGLLQRTFIERNGEHRWAVRSSFNLPNLQIA